MCDPPFYGKPSFFPTRKFGSFTFFLPRVLHYKGDGCECELGLATHQARIRLFRPDDCLVVWYLGGLEKMRERTISKSSKRENIFPLTWNSLHLANHRQLIRKLWKYLSLRRALDIRRGHFWVFSRHIVFFLVNGCACVSQLSRENLGLDLGAENIIVIPSPVREGGEVKSPHKPPFRPKLPTTKWQI